jgi:hypothetical protein
VVFYVYGNEIIGFLTVGYKNLHLYLWEAMKLLIMPTASDIRSHNKDYKDIVKAVMKNRPFIHCKRETIIATPSVLLAEKEKELEYQENLKTVIS